MRKKRPAEDRFWEKVDKTENCWLWSASVNNQGYGEIHLGERNDHCYAHRFSWMINKGPIPKGLFVLHRCDNPRCVNPNHLFLGTQKDNLHDAMAKGRMPILVKGSEFHARRREQANS